MVTRKNKIKMDLADIEWGGVDWVSLAQDMENWRVFVNAVMNLQVSQSARKLSSAPSISAQLQRVS
jgi:hypothetical protein